MVKKNPFTKEQGAYLAYIQRWKATGEGLPKPCASWCTVHRGEEPTKRIHFVDFCEPLRKLAEVEFYLIALKNDGKTRGGPYPKLVKEARDLRALLLIEPDKEKEEEKEEQDEEAEKEETDDASTATLVEEADSFEETVRRGQDIRRQQDEQRAQKKQDDDGTITV